MKKIQFITHQTKRFSYVEGAQMAIEGGCRWIQLRMKEKENTEIIRIARQIESLCRQYKAIFIINDHIELVKEVHADGVHLGKLDMPISKARQILGPRYIIGGTANTYIDVVNHYRAGADYIGYGPFRFTTTKKELSPILGIEGYRSIISQMNQNNIRLPLVAIGGIQYEDIPTLMQTGINGIALSGSVLQASDPKAEMQRIINI